MPKKISKPIINAAEEREASAIAIRLRQLRSEKLTAKDAVFLERWNRDHTKAVCEAFLRCVPKGVYCQLAGRQQKVVDEFGARYEVALIGSSVNLFSVIATLHSRVSELAAIARPFQDADDAELHREKLRQEIIKLEHQSAGLKIDIDKKMNSLVEKSDVIERLEWLAGQLQSLGSRLHRVGGPEAQMALNEFLEAMAIELDGGSLAV
jgi:hypothetical protein